MVRVLVIDEDQATRAVIDEALTAAGHTVQSTVDAIVGLTMMERQLPDVVLIDASTHHWDTEVFAWTCKHHLRLRDVPIVLMENPFTLTSTPLRELGTAILPKPVDPENAVRILGERFTLAAA